MSKHPGHSSHYSRLLIPHHAGAMLMCRQAPIEDPEIEKLCGNIISSQQIEIDWMKAKLSHPAR